MRCRSFGYSDSLDRKKQYVQSILQVDPLGLASRWKPGGPSAGIGGLDTPVGTAVGKTELGVDMG
jgi:hypothetical protein